MDPRADRPSSRKMLRASLSRSRCSSALPKSARGDADAATTIRQHIRDLVGNDLRRLGPGSPEAAALKKTLITAGAWSQYLEVGIGPNAEIFTKAQPMSAVGTMMDVGVHPKSTWTNPEPEIVLIVSSEGRIVGATLGNDVNLRDVEGRFALLLGTAKDNNAAAAVGPFIRLFGGGHIRYDAMHGTDTHGGRAGRLPDDGPLGNVGD